MAEARARGAARGGRGCCPPMDLFRSEPMQLVQIIIPIESAHVTVSYLGDVGLLQFKDLNAEKSPFQRTYAAQIKRCAEMARKLRFFKEQMEKAGVLPSKMSATKEDVKMDDLEVKIGELETELVEINTNDEKLQRTYNELVEYKVVLQKAGEFFASALRNATAQQREMESMQAGEATMSTPLLQDQEISNDSKPVNLGFLAGLVPKDKSMAFERIIFRATRGNVYMRQTAVEEPVIDPVSGEKVSFSTFC